jgi:hypothetical protein
MDSLLQEKYLPHHDVRRVESIEVASTPGRLFPLIEELDFRKAKLTSVLFRLRGLPVPESMSLVGLTRLGFRKLERLPEQELILGLIGRFWTPSGKLQKFAPEEFIPFSDPAYAKATWSFELTPITAQRMRLSTETRVYCSDPKVARRFRRYWFCIQPFSSLIRREILDVIRQQAEREL